VSRIILGEWIDGGDAKLDLDSLLKSRLLLQAGSGFGKSRTLRRILEQTAGKVQQFVIDPEGEFATLREKYDYVIAAVNHGDAVAHPHTAGLLCRRLMETGVSAIIDISELKKPERRRFVRLFLEELMQLPKELWSELLVVIDESHEFAPEKDEAESLSAVVDLATRGRKRGYALLAATQRIGKFSKDAAAELHNKLIGYTSLDIDIKRAAFELGMTPKDAHEALRQFKPGDFYAFGPAITTQIHALHVGGVETTHPQPGRRGKFRAPPKPTAAIMAILPKLADLPKEAEEQARTVEALTRELATVKRELTIAKRAQPTAAPPVDITEKLKAAEQRGFDRGWKEYSRGAHIERQALKGQLMKAVQAAFGGETLIEKPKTEIKIHIPERVHKTPLQRAAPKTNGDATTGLSAAARKILAVLAQYPEGCTANKLALLTCYSYSGGFRNSLSELRTAGYIEGSNTGTMTITPDGLAQGPFELLPTGDELLAYWLNHQSLGKAAREILKALSDGVSRTADELATTTGYEYSGGFRNALSELRTAGVITGKNTGSLRISREIVA
jgi:hypothetical protein